MADRVWVARYEWFDVNVSLVGGDRGLLVVDTHASAVAAREVIDDVRRLGAGEVVAVVNTHEHFDHTFGNGEFRDDVRRGPDPRPRGRGRADVAAGERIKARYDDPKPDDPHRDEVQATEIVPADTTFSSAVALDLGDRMVELVHPGRGHTGGDLVVRVPDADVRARRRPGRGVALRNGVPGFGADCFPMEWPLTLDIVLGLTTPPAVVVPGHGAPVDREFVEDQRNAIGDRRRDDPRPGHPRRTPGRGARRRRVALPARGAGRRRTPRLRAPPPQPEAAAAGLSRLVGTSRA